MRLTRLALETVEHITPMVERISELSRNQMYESARALFELDRTAEITTRIDKFGRTIKTKPSGFKEIYKNGELVYQRKPNTSLYGFDSFVKEAKDGTPILEYKIWRPSESGKLNFRMTTDKGKPIIGEGFELEKLNGEINSYTRPSPQQQNALAQISQVQPLPLDHSVLNNPIVEPIAPPDMSKGKSLLQMKDADKFLTKLGAMAERYHLQRKADLNIPLG